MKKMYITGTSGTGKTTIAKALNDSGIYSFDIDSIPNLCHWENKESGKKADWSPGIGAAWIKAHNWICDPVMLKNILDEQTKDVVITGIASNQDEYLDLFDKVFLLQSTEKTFIERILKREDNDFGKDSSEQKIILGYYKDFEKSLLAKGAISIDTENSVDTTVKTIISYLKEE
ncbi:AAA family ATPase [Patescibacteria group bacterium]|nr:AAA family ATPase [Patescibacteria group bacterium]